MFNEGRAPVIVIDGPAGAGKSTVAREVARRLGLPFLDTGAIYRAIALVMTRSGIPPEDTEELRGVLRDFDVSFSGTSVFVGGEDVTGAIRTPGVDASVSLYSALPVVRDSLLDIQRSRRKSGLVAEGRDMGTVVFPDADVKVFLTASPEARAARRRDERTAKGEPADYGEILRLVAERDRLDTTRDVAPLMPAEDALIIDSTDMSPAEVADRITERAARIGALG
jgi:cytidylate kinase